MSAVTIDSAHPLPPSAGTSSVLAACLRRGAQQGWRLVVTAPAEARFFLRSRARFWERRIDPAQHAQWAGAYRVFVGGRERAYDRASWRVLAVDDDRRVVGAITARFFCGELVQQHLFISDLLESASEVFRDACEIALADHFAAAQGVGRMPAEISHWSVALGADEKLLGLTLTRAVLALGAAFDHPLAVLAVNHRRAEFRRLQRWGAVPLGREGSYYLPPFVHRASGGSYRLMVVDTAKLGARTTAAAADLEVLRTSCPIISVP
jgi:hypothetical protein